MLGALLLSSALRCADVAELADALDSGSSGHCARAGSSPVIRSNADKVIRNDDLFYFSKNSLRPIWFEAFCFVVDLQGFLEK